MAQPKNAMEVFALLEKSNCRECGEKTCLAFAGAVFTGKRAMTECPRLAGGAAASLLNDDQLERNEQTDMESMVAPMLNQVTSLDYAKAAERTGGSYDGKVLRLKILGKDFGIDREGNFITLLHVNPWVVGPLLDYVLHSKGVQPGDAWCSFRELRGGAVKYPLFAKRAEEALGKVAFEYPELFSDMVQLFGATTVPQHFKADVSVLLHPLPLVPLLICYWQPEEGMAADLKIFFERSVEHNLGLDSAFSIGTGLVQMFERLSRLHGTERTTQ